MKKILTLLLTVMLVMAASLGTLTACDIEVSGDYEVTATGKTDSIKLIKDYLSDAFKDINVVATSKVGENVMTVENIVGDKSFIVFNSTGAKSYTFIQDNNYYFATENEGGEGGYYFKDKSYYDIYHCYFMTSIRYLDELPDGNATFSCVSKGTEKTKGEQVLERSGEINFTYSGDLGSITIKVVINNAVVESATYTIVNVADDFNQTTVITFSYNTATVNLPDITNWTDMTESVE